MNPVALSFVIAYVFAILLKLICAFHAYLSLPPSGYSRSLLISFFLLIVVDIYSASIIPFSPASYSDEPVTTSNDEFRIATIFYQLTASIAFTSFGFTQSEFLKSFAPYDETLSRRIVRFAQVFLGLTCIIDVTVALLPFALPQLAPVLNNVLSSSLLIVDLFDLFINTYLLYFVIVKLRRFTNARQHKLIFFLSWLIAIMTLFVSISIAVNTGGKFGKTLTTSALIIQFYPECSYFCMVMTRLILASKNTSRPKQHRKNHIPESPKINNQNTPETLSKLFSVGANDIPDRNPSTGAIGIFGSYIPDDGQQSYHKFQTTQSSMINQISQSRHVQTVSKPKTTP